MYKLWLYNKEEKGGGINGTNKSRSSFKKLWKEYIETKLELTVIFGSWNSEMELKLDKIKKTDEIVKYVEEEIDVE